MPSGSCAGHAGELAQGRFYLVTRHYSPKAAILTGDWAPPPVTAR